MQISDIIKQYKSVKSSKIECIGLKSNQFYLIELNIYEPEYIMDVLILGTKLDEEIYNLLDNKVQIKIKYVI